MTEITQRERQLQARQQMLEAKECLIKQKEVIQSKIIQGLADKTREAEERRKQDEREWEGGKGRRMHAEGRIFGRRRTRAL